MWRNLTRTYGKLGAALVLAGGLAASPVAAQQNQPGWQGWYAAALLGYAWTDIAFAIPPNNFSETLNGFTGGVAGGANAHVSEDVIIGFEADITFGDVMDDMSLARHKVSLVGRLGVLVTPSTLVFGVAGLAGGQYEAKVAVTTTSSTIVFVDEEIPVTITTTTTGNAERDKRLWGYTLGGGFETEITAFAVPARLGLEYRYTDFREWDFVALGQAFSIDPDVQEVRARLIVPIN